MRGRDFYMDFGAHSNGLADRCYCGGGPTLTRTNHGANLKCNECAEIVTAGDPAAVCWKWNKKMRALK